MKDISLKDLLEAGCHFGHKVSRWHPKATTFIYQAREGIHIIDLAKTKDGLQKAAEYVKKLGEEGKLMLVVATKRQAKGVVTEAAKRAGLPYLTNRWVGGFITNWEAVKSNIEKVNRMKSEQLDGSWKKFPKHEQVKLEKDLKKLLMVYGGVVELTKLPDAFFMVDIKTENNCLKETQRKSLPVIAIVDTNADPNNVEYPIPANDDAVGSIQHLINYIADAYIEGREIREKLEGKAEKKKINSQQITENKEEIKEIKAEIKTVENKEVKPEVKPEKKKDEEKTSEVEVKEEKKEVIKVKKSTKSQKPKSK